MQARFEVVNHSRGGGKRARKRKVGKGRPRKSAGDVAAYTSRTVITREMTGVAAYRGREALTSADGNRVYDYRYKGGLVFQTILAPDHAPDWARVRQSLWTAIDLVENRVDSRLCKELLVSFLRELPLEIQILSLLDELNQHLVSRDLVVDVCVHAYGEPLDPNNPIQRQRIEQLVDPSWPKIEMEVYGAIPEEIPDYMHVLVYPEGQLRLYQPHAHVLLTTRPIGSEKFARKKDRWLDDEDFVWEMRRAYIGMMNELVAAYGIDAWFDVRSASSRAGDDEDGWLESETEVLDTRPRPPQAADCGGGFRAAMDGRPPTDPNAYPPGEAPMDLNFIIADKNLELRRSAAEIRNLKTAAGERLAVAIEVVEKLEAEGFKFIANDAGKLVAYVPHRAATKEEEAAWDGLEAAVVAHFQGRDQAAQTVAQRSQDKLVDAEQAVQWAQSAWAEIDRRLRAVQADATQLAQDRDDLRRKLAGEKAWQASTKSAFKAGLAGQASSSTGDTDADQLAAQARSLKQNSDRSTAELKSERRKFAGLKTAIVAGLDGKEVLPTGDAETDALAQRVGWLQQNYARLKDIANKAERLLENLANLTLKALDKAGLGNKLAWIPDSFRLMAQVVAGKEPAPSSTADILALSDPKKRPEEPQEASNSLPGGVRPDSGREALTEPPSS